MDFHAMKRKKLQALCKKHRIPANMKNVEMADRLASLFEKETEEPLTDSTSFSEDSLECDGIMDDLVVSKEAKRVRFSPENEVFEFTRSVKRCQAKNVRRRSKGPVQDLQQNGIELRRSKRILAKGKTISGSNQNEANTRRGRWPDVTKALKLPRRIGSTAGSQQESKVTGLMVLEQFEYEDTSDGLSGSDQDDFKLAKTGRRSIRLASKAGALLPVQRSKRLADIEDKEEKLVKNNAKEVSMDSEFHDTEKYHRKDVQDEPKVEKFPRRSGRFVNAKESKEERKTKQTKGSTVVNSQEGELVKNKTKEPLIDCKVVQTTENYPSMKVQDVSKVEKVLRRSKRPGTDINVLLDKRHVKAVNRDDWGVEKAPIVVEGNLVQKKSDETLEKKRDRSVEPEMIQSAQFEQEEAGGANVESKGSSKKLKKMNQECAKDRPQGTIEKSPSSSKTKATESVMITENVLDSTLKKLVDSSQRTNTQELNSELMEGNHEEKLEEDTVLMDAIEDDKKEVSSCSVLLSERSPPPSVHEVSNPRAEFGVPTGYILVKDIASTVIAKQDIKTKEEIHISIPRSELKENSFVAKLAEAEANLENSAECWNEIQSSKDSEKGSLEKTIQAENLHGNFSEYSNENSKVGCISVSHCVNLEKLDEVKAESLEKSKQRSSCERGCKLNALELRRCSSTHFTSHSLKENNVKCSDVDEIKALSLPLPRNNDASAFGELAIFTTPEKKLMLMEQISEKGKTLAVDSVTHHNDAEVQSHAVAFTTPKRVSSLGDAGIDEARKEEEHIATKFPHVINTTESYLVLGGFKQTEARNEGESILVELHDKSDISTSPERQFSVGDSKGERSERNEDNRTAENYDESVVFTGPVGDLFGSFGQDKAIESEGKKVVQFFEGSGLTTGLHCDQPLADSELIETGWQGINSADKSGLFTSVERQLLCGAFEQKEAVKTGEKAAAEFHDGHVVPNIPVRRPFPEDSKLEEAAKGEENKPVELRVDSGIFTSAEKHLLLGTDEGVKGDNITAKSHVVSDVLAAVEHQSLMGDSEPDEAGKKYRENKDVDLLSESNTSTSKISREQSPHVDSVNLFDFHIEEAETILEAERNVSFRSNVLALPAKGNSENYLEVAGTCSMVSEESGPSTNNQNQINDVLEELAITDNNEADELIEAKVTPNIQMGFEGNLLLNSSSGSYVSGKTCILAGTENKDEAGVPIATALEKAISLTSDELTVQNHMNEQVAADEEMITRGTTTPIPEETMDSSPENRKEYLNIDESGTLSKRQARRETILITRTQVKPTRHDMKENAPNSKIGHNLNVTAPRTSKRQPLQDLSKN